MANDCFAYSVKTGKIKLVVHSSLKMATLSHKYLAGLNNSQFSQIIKEQKNKQTGQVKKVRSLLTTIEHYLFAWDKVDCCLLVKNLLDADSWAEDKKDSGAKPPKDRFLVCDFSIAFKFT